MRDRAFLPRPEKKPVGGSPACFGVMHEMRLPYVSEVRKAKKNRYRKALVNKPVVNDEVRHAEKRHPDADPERNFAPPTRLGDASEQDECDRDRRMKDRKSIVRLESTTAPLVVRSMHRPQYGVPNFSVQQARPVFHRHKNRERNRNPEDDFHASLR